MAKNNKKVAIIISITIVILLSIVAAYFFLRKKENTSSLNVSALKVEETLAFGSSGEEVKRLQNYLNGQLKLSVWKDLPMLNGQEIKELDVDGIFGSKTQAVVQWRFGTSSISTNKF